MAATATATASASPAPTISTPRPPSTPSKPFSRDPSQSASFNFQPPPPPPVPQSQLSFPTPEAEYEFLGTVEGEIAFFRSTMRARPVGKHRHFHVLAIRNAIFQATGRTIRIETIWKKLRDCWDLDALDAIDVEAESYVVPRRGAASKPTPIRSPSPSENLASHAFFREEFSLPYFDPTIQSLLDARRLRDSVSVASTPPATPAAPQPQRKKPGPPRGRKRKSKANMAGLVGGDSDSSALTQESADEGGGVEGSVITATEAGEDSGEDDDVDMQDPSPEPVEEPPTEQPMPRRRGRPPKNRGRARGAAPAPSTRGAKKRKRG